MEDLVSIACNIKNDLLKLDAKISSLNIQNTELKAASQELINQNQELKNSYVESNKNSAETISRYEERIKDLSEQNEQLILLKDAIEQKNIELKIECARALKEVEKALAAIGQIENININQLTNSVEYNGDSRSTTQG